MDRQLMDLVLPRLARPLYLHLEGFQTGRIDESQFTERFEALLRRQHAWLAGRGVSAGRAAVAIHAAVLVLSRPGLRSEAEEEGVPLEVVEFRAVREAAQDVACNYGLNAAKAAHLIAGLVAQYGE